MTYNNVIQIRVTEEVYNWLNDKYGKNKSDFIRELINNAKDNDNGNITKRKNSVIFWNFPKILLDFRILPYIND